MKGRTIPKHTTPNQIVDAINAVGAYSISAVAEELGMRHSAVIYHFNEIPILKRYYYSLHTTLVEEQIEKEKREKIEEIESVLNKSRKNPQYIELYKQTGMTHQEFFGYVHGNKNLENLFYGLYDGLRKMSMKTIMKMRGLIDKRPKGTPMYKLKKGINSYNYLSQSPELTERYEKRHGKIKVGRPMAQTV